MNWNLIITRLRCKHVAQADHAKGYVCTKCGKGLFGPNTTLLGEIVSRFLTWFLFCLALSVCYLCGEWAIGRIVWCWAKLKVTQRTEDTLAWLQDRPVLLVIAICLVIAVIGTLISFVSRDDTKEKKHE